MEHWNKNPRQRPDKHKNQIEQPVPTGGGLVPTEGGSEIRHSLGDGEQSHFE